MAVRSQVTAHSLSLIGDELNATDSLTYDVLERAGEQLNIESC